MNEKAGWAALDGVSGMSIWEMEGIWDNLLYDIDVSEQRITKYVVVTNRRERFATNVSRDLRKVSIVRSTVQTPM